MPAAENLAAYYRVFSVHTVLAGARKIFIKKRSHYNHRRYYTISLSRFPVSFFLKRDIRSRISILAIETVSAVPP